MRHSENKFLMEHLLQFGSLALFLLVLSGCSDWTVSNNDVLNIYNTKCKCFANYSSNVPTE